MLSAEDIAAVKIAIEICNKPELKREILCAPGSNYYIYRVSDWKHRRKQWDELVSKKAALILEKYDVEEQLREKVISLVLSVGIRMLTWAAYHEGTLGLLREYSVNFLNNSFFTQEGLIDNEKAAEELMKAVDLSVKQKYLLSCLYCFTKYIPALYNQMTEDDRKEFYDAERPQIINQPGIVKFWFYHQMGEIDKLKGKKSLDQYRFEKAVESGSKAAVKYCLEKTSLRVKKDAIVDAAEEAVKCEESRPINVEEEWYLFGIERYKDSEGSVVPSDYYVDILCFLLSKMTEDQETKFLNKDIKVVKFKIKSIKVEKRCVVLEYFLNWPYQNYFMKAVGLMCEFLRERDYFALLLRICNKIESQDGSFRYGEEKIYDYRNLLSEFWHKSPERCKRYVFSNQEAVDTTDGTVEIKARIMLISKLFALRNFTHQDEENFRNILKSATDEERRKICIDLMREEKWEILDRVVVSCFSSKPEADEYKSQLSFTKEALDICIDFVKSNKWDAAESFIVCLASSEEKKDQLQRAMIDSEYGRLVCIELFLRDRNVKAVDKFVRWFIPSEDVKAFSKELIFSNIGVHNCADFVAGGELELASEFINWSFSSEEEVKELKKTVAYTAGCSILVELISDYSEEGMHHGEEGYHPFARRTKFQGGQWKKVEKFLNWCFSSEEEISEFKKQKLLVESGEEIHFNLIKCSELEEAERFFEWLGLSAEEIKELKRNTLFNHDAASEMLIKLIFSEKRSGRFADYGSNEEAIAVLFRWYLTDKETILEFSDRVWKCYDVEEKTENIRRVLENFDLAIKKRLNELDEEHNGK